MVARAQRRPSRRRRTISSKRSMGFALSRPALARQTPVYRVEFLSAGCQRPMDTSVSRETPFFCLDLLLEKCADRFGEFRTSLLGSPERIQRSLHSPDGQQLPDTIEPHRVFANGGGMPDREPHGMIHGAKQGRCLMEPVCQRRFQRTTVLQMAHLLGERQACYPGVRGNGQISEKILESMVGSGMEFQDQGTALRFPFLFDPAVCPEQ